MNELKPCPNCGSIPEYVRTGEFNQYWTLICPYCLHSAEKWWGEGRSTKIGARMKWNRMVRKGI
jgi:hypothetical protein